MTTRKERIAELKSTALDYIAKERTRVQNEVKVLQAVLDGRTGGAGIQKVSVKVVAAAADKDLASFVGNA